MWGKKPKEFFVDYMGAGIGKHPAFEIVPGAWNIFLLCSKIPETLLTSTPEQYPTDTSMVGPCVGGAYQLVPHHDGETAGQLALTLDPVEFVLALSDFKTFIPKFFLSELWEDEVLERAKRLRGAVATAPQVLPQTETTVVSLDAFRESKLRRG